jgi:hypothetical protein
MRHPSEDTRSSFLTLGPSPLAAAVVLAGALLAVACGPEPAPEEERDADAAVARDHARGLDADTVHEAVLAELRAYYQDLSARDWQAFRDHFWSDGTITTIWRPQGEEEERVMVQTAAEFAEAGPEGPGSREIFEEEMVSHRADVDGRAGVATVWAGYRARFGDPGDVTEWEGTDVFTLLRHDGRWRIASLVFVPESGGGSEAEDASSREDAPTGEEASAP